jgi:hypothetical protein
VIAVRRTIMTSATRVVSHVAVIQQAVWATSPGVTHILELVSARRMLKGRDVGGEFTH